MVREIKARVSHRKIALLEKLDLKEGEEVIILVKESPAAAPSWSGGFSLCAGWS
jgi:hypothetical protein